ncbi:MAG: long-chain fatty acid--CoA ligase [Candidatus Poribacteria bacterium]|nr:long-chain fatty acid--CoA ligase [Candidatus Poribacteria bacterium]
MQGLMMDYPLTIDRILEHANRIYPRKKISTKLPDGSMHRYTYANLYGRVKRLANVLDKLGVEPGDRVGTFAWNNYQHLELYYAIPGSGAVIHTLNIRLFPEQLAYVVNHAEDKVVFIDATLLPLFEKVADEIESVQHYVLFNTDAGVETKLPNVSLYEDLMAEASDDYNWRVTDENTAMGLCYTSGTTGDPKGTLYSHRSMYLHTMGANQANVLALTERDVVLPVVPMFHAMAWGLPYSCAFAGAEMILPGPHLQPAALAEMIAEEKVTVPAGVPTIWMMLYQELQENPRDVSHIRVLTVGGAAMPRALIESYEKELDVSVLHAWGMTELSPIGTVSQLQTHHLALPEHEQWDVKERQGYPVAGVEMRIVNEAGEEVSWDGITMGEVQVRGPWIAKGYYKLDASPDHFTPDGWFRTGDVATISEDAYMHITDRTKDLVKSGGEWISSVVLENGLMAHPKVMEAAVIAIPDERWGERPMAVAVLVPEAGAVTTEELNSYLAAKFAKFWLPDKIAFVDEIPKTSVGKFDKKVLRHRYAEGQLG